METSKPQLFNQPGSTEYILRSVVSRSPSGVVNLAPGTAKRILEDLNFPGQRRVDAVRSFRHKVRITEGVWSEAYPIHFASLPDGRLWLVDGQHRLTVISGLEAAIKVTIRIVEMLSEQAARNFYAGFDDKGSVRTNVQILDAVGIADKLNLSNRMARAVYEAAPIIMNKLEPLTGSSHVRSNPGLFVHEHRLATVAEWAEQAKQYEQIIEGAGLLYEKLRKTGAVAVALYTLRYQPAKAKTFWGGVAANDGLRKGDPRHTLVQDLLLRDIGSGSVRQKVQQSSLAWNAFCEGRDLKIIKCVTNAPIILWGTPINGKGHK